MQGLGDNIYQRGFVKNLGRPVWLETSWPQLYRDIPGVRFVRPVTRLRTQSKNVAAQKVYETPPRRLRSIRIGYGSAELARGSIVDAMRRQFGVEPDFGLPDFGPCPVQADAPIAVVRPVTARQEWLNEARNPEPRYVYAATMELRKRGYFVVSVADLAPNKEWLVGGMCPPANLHLHKGELGVEALLSLVQHAAVVVGGVGWIVPACIASGTPLYCVLGGCGGHNAPEVITSPRMDLSKVGWARPNRYCMCTQHHHNCDKVISGFNRGFSLWLDKQGVGGRAADGVAAPGGEGVLPGPAGGHAVRPGVFREVPAPG